MELSQAQGAISTGPMVPVLRVPSVEEAREACRLLDLAAIPALVDRDLEGGVLFPVAREGAAVLVPLAFHAEAARLLSTRSLLQVPAAPIDPPQPEGLVGAGEDAVRELPYTPPPLAGRLTAVIAVIAAVIALQLLLVAWVGAPTLRAEWAAQSPLAPNLWRLVTAGLVHSGATHLLSNALFGAVVASALLGSHGWGGTWLVWTLGSAVGLSAELLLSPGSSIVGASAGNYALLGLWIFGQLERAQVLTLSRRELLRTAGVALLLLPGAITPITASGARVAVLAHVAGALFGFLAGWLVPRRLEAPTARDVARDRRYGIAAACLTAWGLSLGLFALATRVA